MTEMIRIKHRSLHRNERMLCTTYGHSEYVTILSYLSAWADAPPRSRPLWRLEG